MSKHQIPWHSESRLIIKDKDHILQESETLTIFFQQKIDDLTEEDHENTIFIGDLDGIKIFALEKSRLIMKKSNYIRFKIGRAHV